MKIQSVRLTSSGSAPAPARRSIPAVLLAALLLAVLSILWAGPAYTQVAGDEAVPEQIVVKLKPKVELATINSEYGTTELEKLLVSKRIYLLRASKGHSPKTVIEQMSADPRILYAEPNFRTESPEGDARYRARPGGVPALSSDPAPYYDQFAIGAMNLAAAHDVTRGAGSVVAVIDTGVQVRHPQLANTLTPARYDFIDDDRVPTDVRNGVDEDLNGAVDEMVGHGTHVAGIVKLAAPEARIMPLRALNSDGFGNIFVLAEAVNYAARNGADVINLSLGASQESEFLMDVLENVAEGDEGMPGGVVVVAAAGNANTSSPHYPAAGGDDVLSVTSVDRERNKSSFANYGAWVDIAAPGSEIYSSFPTNRYARWDGTSMATPFVAGQAALLHGQVPVTGVEPDEIGEHRVECVSRVIARTAQPLADGSLGAGHADAGAGVNYMQSTGCLFPQDGGDADYDD